MIILKIDLTGIYFDVCHGTVGHIDQVHEKGNVTLRFSRAMPHGLILLILIIRKYGVKFDMVCIFYDRFDKYITLLR